MFGLFKRRKRSNETFAQFPTSASLTDGLGLQVNAHSANGVLSSTATWDAQSQQTMAAARTGQAAYTQWLSESPDVVEARLQHQSDSLYSLAQQSVNERLNYEASAAKARYRNRLGGSYSSSFAAMGLAKLAQTQGSTLADLRLRSRSQALSEQQQSQQLATQRLDSLNSVLGYFSNRFESLNNSASNTILTGLKGRATIADSQLKDDQSIFKTLVKLFEINSKKAQSSSSSSGGSGSSGGGG